MSPQSSANPGGVYVKKPKADIYTALLFVALVALVIGITMLCKEMERYNWEFKAAAMRSAPAPVAVSYSHLG
jgi:hypothetical protein